MLRNGAPDTIAGWKALVDGLLTDQACAFHRNLEISSRYAWIYKLLPDCFKWAGMAAFASHHVRYALFPFRLDTDRTGYVDIPHSLGRRRLLLLGDVNTIRETNNAIFDDIFWAHLAYGTAEDDGIGLLRACWRGSRTTALLSGFEGSVWLAGFESRSTPGTGSWRTRRRPRRRAGRRSISSGRGNVELLEHEQRALVQPQPRPALVRVRQALLDRLGPDVRGAGPEGGGHVLHVVLPVLAHARDAAGPAGARVAEDHALRRPLALDRDEHRPALHAGSMPTRASSTTSLRRIFDEARDYAGNPCVLPHASYQLSARTPSTASTAPVASSSSADARSRTT